MTLLSKYATISGSGSLPTEETCVSSRGCADWEAYPTFRSTISPNLDALLELEEESHRQEDHHTSRIQTSFSSKIEGDEPNYTTSLPPPPRKSRKQQSLGAISLLRSELTTPSPPCTLDSSKDGPPVLPPLNLFYVPTTGLAPASLEDELSELLTLSSPEQPGSHVWSESTSPATQLPSTTLSLETLISPVSRPSSVWPLGNGSHLDVGVAIPTNVANAGEGGLALQVTAAQESTTAPIAETGPTLVWRSGDKQFGARNWTRTQVISFNVTIGKSSTPGEISPALNMPSDGHVLPGDMVNARNRESLQVRKPYAESRVVDQSRATRDVATSTDFTAEEYGKDHDLPRQWADLITPRKVAKGNGMQPDLCIPILTGGPGRGLKKEPECQSDVGEQVGSLPDITYSRGVAVQSGQAYTRPHNGDLIQNPISHGLFAPSRSQPTRRQSTSGLDYSTNTSSSSRASHTPFLSINTQLSTTPYKHRLSGSIRSHHSDIEAAQSFIEITPEAATDPFADNDPTPSPSPSPFPRSTAISVSRTTMQPQSASRSNSPATLKYYDGSKPKQDNLPPTTNFLDLEERADLIRKSRKLTQLFGQPPSADALVQELKSSSPKRGHQRGALSLNVQPVTGHEATTPGRPYSNPLIPDELSVLSEVIHDQEAESNSISDVADSDGKRLGRHESLTSFIDLSEDEEDRKAARKRGKKRRQEVRERGDVAEEVEVEADRHDEDQQLLNRNQHHSRIPSSASAITISTLSTLPKFDGGRRPFSPTAQSLFENMTPEESAEEDRRRKREKLAKLHRFLGSRVPANLVLGTDIPPLESMLPPAAFDSAILGENEDSVKGAWTRRRRSSSAAAFPSWSDDVDRMREELGDKEKALNVRRAQKMEKVFGVAPPQSLYHTRPPPASSSNHPISHIPGYIDAVASPPTNFRNPNQSAYTRAKYKRYTRPGTADSASRHLLSKSRESNDPDEIARSQQVSSLVYNHYQHSLNSLNDIIDRDDKESLAELHEYLNSGDIATVPFSMSNQVSNRRTSITSMSSTKSERRHSLPTRTSIISLSSEHSVTVPKPEPTDFQLRRRRAAKLTQFFGVDYRELIRDVLESIENGLEHERNRGTLNAEEVEDLMYRLRKLRVKRDGAL